MKHVLAVAQKFTVIHVFMVTQKFMVVRTLIGDNREPLTEDYNPF
ncbi:hypothetical protein [Bartonella elizabethae]|nr:hypothetical protein [Bartonella elizabethae]